MMQIRFHSKNNTLVIMKFPTRPVVRWKQNVDESPKNFFLELLIIQSLKL